jgi:hypothetical protein
VRVPSASAVTSISDRPAETQAQIALERMVRFPESQANQSMCTGPSRQLAVFRASIWTRHSRAWRTWSSSARHSGDQGPPIGGLAGCTVATRLGAQRPFTTERGHTVGWNIQTYVVNLLMEDTCNEEQH